jgi:hypothetical protein
VVSSKRDYNITIILNKKYFLVKCGKTIYIFTHNFQKYVHDGVFKISGKYIYENNINTLQQKAQINIASSVKYRNVYK